MYITNIAKIKLGKAKNRLTGLFNNLSNSFNNSLASDLLFKYDFRFDEKKTREMADYLSRDKKELKKLSRRILLQTYKKELANRCSKIEEQVYFFERDNEKLSNEIISEAVNWKKLNIDYPESLSTENKAKIISERYASIIRERIKDFNQEMSKEQKEKTDKIIDQQLENITEKEKYKLKEALNGEKLTGEILRKSLLSAGGPLAAISIAQFSGIEAFLALTTVMNAVFTTTLGITLPFAAYTGATSALSIMIGPVGWLLFLGIGGKQFWNGKKNLDRMLLAQSVWFMFNHLDFDYRKESNPDWMPDRKENKIIELENMASKLLEEITEIKLEKDKIEYELNLNRELKKEYEIKYKNTEKELKGVEIKIQKLEKKLNKKSDKINNENSAKSNKEIKRMIDYFEIFIFSAKALERIDKMNAVSLNRLIKRLMKAQKYYFSKNEIKYRRIINNRGSGKIIEQYFGSGRIYLLAKNNKYHVCLIGDKNSQNQDLNWRDNNCY